MNKCVFLNTITLHTQAVTAIPRIGAKVGKWFPFTKDALYQYTCTGIGQGVLEKRGKNPVDVYFAILR